MSDSKQQRSKETLDMIIAELEVLNKRYETALRDIKAELEQTNGTQGVYKFPQLGIGLAIVDLRETGRRIATNTGILLRELGLRFGDF